MLGISPKSRINRINAIILVTINFEIEYSGQRLKG